MKKTLLILVFVIIVVIFVSITTLLQRSNVNLQTENIKDSATIIYENEFHYRQTINDCGPFNTAAVTRALTKQNVSSAEYAQKIGWRLPNNYTIPNGLVRQLQSEGLNAIVPNISDLIDEQKIDYLRQEISQNHPVIILGERDGFEHYITLFGFNLEKEEFYLYDSFLEKDPERPDYTIDTNGDDTGNRTYTTEELLNFWQGGGIYGLYEWYAIVASK